MYTHCSRRYKSCSQGYISSLTSATHVYLLLPLLARPTDDFTAAGTPNICCCSVAPAEVIEIPGPEGRIVAVKLDKFVRFRCDRLSSESVILSFCNFRKMAVDTFVILSTIQARGYFFSSTQSEFTQMIQLINKDGTLYTRESDIVDDLCKAHFMGDETCILISHIEDVSTIQWPNPNERELRSALFDAREMGMIPNAQSVQLPDGSEFSIDGDRCRACEGDRVLSDPLRECDYCD